MPILSPVHPFRRALTAAVLFGLLAAPARAQGGAEAAPDDYQHLIYAASRYAQVPAQAPASVTIITREEILAYGYRTLADVLNAVPGIFSSYDRNYTYMTVRGLARQGDFNTRILLMVDGHRLNDAVSDEAYSGTESALDLDAVERVEVILGPGSSLYGTNAFYAVVNVVSRQGRALQGAEGAGGYASFGAWRGTAAYGRRFNRSTEFFLSGGAYRSDGPQELFYPAFDQPGNNNGIAVNADGDHYEKALSSFSFGDFRLQGLYSNRVKTIPTASYQTDFGTRQERTTDRQSSISLDYEHPFEDLSRLWLTLSYNAFRYSGVYPYGGVINRDYQYADWWTLSGQYLWLFGAGHKISVGGETRWNVRQNQSVYDVNPSYTYFTDKASSKVYAGFVQGDFRLAARLHLYAGVRYDHYDNFGGTTNPRGALVFDVAPGTTLKAMYGRAFRAPNPYEFFYNDGNVTQKASPGLTPEKIQTFELALDRKLGRGLRGTVSVYHLRVNDLIGLTVDPVDSLLQFRNVDDARSTGVELALDGRLAGRLDGRVSYAYQHASNAGSNAQPINSPWHLARVGVSLPFLADRLRGSVEVRYVGERPTLAGSQDPSYTIANVTLLARPFGADGLELSGTVYNVFDEAYGDPGGGEHLMNIIPMDGRTARVGVRYRF